MPPKPRSDFLRAAQARTQAILDSGRLSPAARARILGHRTPIAPAIETRITINLRTGERTVEQLGPRAETRNPFERSSPKPIPPPPPPPAPAPTPRSPSLRIIAAVAAAFEVEASELLAFSRRRTLVRPRMALYWLLRQRGLSLNKIGRLLKRDHTSVVHGERRARELHDTDREWRARYDRAVSILGGAA